MDPGRRTSRWFSDLGGLLSSLARATQIRPTEERAKMAPRRIVCPECGASVKSARTVAEGQRVRCPECRAVLTAGEEEARGKGGGSSSKLILLLGGLFLLLLLGSAGVGVYYLLAVGGGGPANSGGGPGTPVTRADL